jgi:hypothetical protein
MPDMDSFRAPNAAALFSARSVSNYRDKVLPPVAPADLVDANGSCAGAYAPSAASGDQSVQANVPLRGAGIPPVPAAIALEMTECDVVKRAGIAERAEIGTNDRRSAPRRSPTPAVSGRASITLLMAVSNRWSLGRISPPRRRPRRSRRSRQAGGSAEPGHGSIARASQGRAGIAIGSVSLSPRCCCL